MGPLPRLVKDEVASGGNLLGEEVIEEVMDGNRIVVQVGIDQLEAVERESLIPPGVVDHLDLALPQAANVTQAIDHDDDEVSEILC